MQSYPEQHKTDIVIVVGIKTRKHFLDTEKTLDLTSCNLYRNFILSPTVHLQYIKILLMHENILILQLFTTVQTWFMFAGHMP
jgi:hypothetical protein